MDKEKNKPILSVRVDAELLERVDKLCERTNVGRAEIVERCLLMGIMDQEELVGWLESPVKGPLVQLLMHPKVLKVLGGLTDHEIDPIQQKMRKNIREKKRLPKGRPATE